MNAEASPIDVGAPPAELEFGVSVRDERVVMTFSHLIQWFDLDPQTAINYAEAVIDAAVRARDNAMAARPIVVAKRLPGIPH